MHSPPISLAMGFVQHIESGHEDVYLPALEMICMHLDTNALPNTLCHNSPLPHMGSGDPAHEFTHVFVMFRVKHQMPMVWHYAVC